jgi:hypothetical protein
MKKSLVYWIGILIISMFYASCGTNRTVQNSTDKKEVDLKEKIIENKDLKVQDTSNVVVSTELTETEVEIIEKITFAPVDPTKPSVFTDEKGNQQTLKNVSYSKEKTTKKSKKKEKSKSEASSGTKLIDKGKKTVDTNLKIKAKAKVKHTEKTVFNWWLILVPIAIYIIWKNKSKIWLFINPLKKNKK